MQARGPYQANIGGHSGHHILVPVTGGPGKAQQLGVGGDDRKGAVDVEEEGEEQVGDAGAGDEEMVSCLKLARTGGALAITTARVEAGHPGPHRQYIM